MKLLLITENWPPRVGGIENYLTNIAMHLPKGSVRVIAPKLSEAENLLPITDYRLLITRFRFFYPLIRPAWLPLYISLYRRAKKNPHNVSLCGKALFEGLIGYYLKKHLGIPYVVFTYAMEIEVWSGQRRTRRKLRRVLTAADRVVYINDITKKKLLELGVTERQLVKIWPGASDAAFGKPDTTTIDAVLAHYNIKRPYILSLGRLIPRKGFDVLIRAFAGLEQTKFADVTLVIAGDGPERDQLEAFAQQELIATSVKFLGHVPDQHRPALYAGAEVFALTPIPAASDTEGFGIVYLEAAAAGTPSIATAVGGASEAVVHNETGLVVEPNAQAVHRALELMLSNRTERERLGQNARQRAYNEFRWSKRIVLVKGMIDAIAIQESKHKTAH